MLTDGVHDCFIRQDPLAMRSRFNPATKNLCVRRARIRGYIGAILTTPCAGVACSRVGQRCEDPDRQELNDRYILRIAR